MTEYSEFWTLVENATGRKYKLKKHTEHFFYNDYGGEHVDTIDIDEFLDHVIEPLEE